MPIVKKYRELILKAMFNLTDECDFGNYTYLGLLTSAPADDGTYTETSGDNYSRVLLSQYISGSYNATSLTNLIQISDGKITNHKEIKFDQCLSAWTGPITHLGLFTAAEGGELIAYSELETPITPVVSHIINLLKEDLEVTFS